MGNIVLLDDLTINKIAAGEVIERPASVIKEMVENSIDAGATNITVEIKNGGISYIKVTDNGRGIANDDLEMAFERHATSKIRSADDRNTVTSMGFRGEALASIAAIANVELISKTINEETVYRIVVEGGNVLEKGEVGSPIGTSITVRNLFFNTPVRYKFLKKDYTESGYIEDVITRIALVNPHIAIKLINTGKTVIQTTGNGDIKTVIYSIYGKEISQSVLEVDYRYEDIEVKGVIGKPEIARSNRVNQIFFVNKRYIKDKILSSATEQAFKGMIPIGKFGFVILNLSINPSKVDVNVHPAKLEVRFEEENKVFQAIYHAIKDTLLKGEFIFSNTEETQSEIKNEIKEEIKPEIKEEKQDLNTTPKIENTHVGLFGFRKNNKEIEKYTDNESRIKTNNIIEQVYNSKINAKNNEENNSEEKEVQNVQEEKEEYSPKIEHGLSSMGPINTEDVLAKLREMQNKIQEEVRQHNRNMQMKKEEKEIIKEDKPISEEVQEVKQENKEEIEQKNEEQFEQIKKNIENLEENTQVVSNNFDEMYVKTFGKLPIQEKPEEKDENNAIDLIKDNVNMFEKIEKYQKPLYKFIGIAFSTYIIIEMENELYIIDQHAAHERIMYEKVKENYYSREVKDSQMLLLPDIITLTHKEMDIAKENMEMFEKAGFTLEEFGENTIKLTGVPTVCIDLDTKELFLETLDEINTVARTAKQEKEERFIATVACKAAVKANMALTREEVESLMDKLLRLPNPFTCPHGRPTAIKMTKYDIERKFSRK